MFPVTETNAVQHQASWLNRIMLSQSKQLTAPAVESRRTFTPLRPNAGLIGRIPTPTVPGIGGSRPSTQQASRTQAEVAVAPQPNSARGRLPTLGDSSMSNGAAKSSFPAKTPLLPSKKGAVAPLRESQMNASIGAGASVSPTVLGSPESRTALISSAKDAHSQHEAAVIAEVNEMRRDPRAYASVARAELRVGAPFLPHEGEDSAPRTLDELSAFLKSRNQMLREAKLALEQIEQGESKEIATMREQWAAEDAERAKKKGKAPAPKKGGAGGVEGAKEKAPEEIEADREAEVAAFTAKNQAARTATRTRIAELTRAVELAHKGVQTLDLLVAKLEATPPLPAVVMNRGLSLAARDLADTEINGSVGVDANAYVARYGSGNGPFLQCLTIGQKDPRTTVLDLLLCLPDSKRAGRHSLLSADNRLIGCGWRHHPTRVAATCLILAGSYSEFAAIAARDHLPLQDIRRTLPFATRISTNVKVRLDVPDDAGIEVVEPVSQPAKTTKKLFRCVVKCPYDTMICAAVVRQGDPEPATPSFVAGSTFVQRLASGEGVEIFAVFPTSAAYRIVLYGTTPRPAAGNPTNLSASRVGGLGGTQRSLTGTAMLGSSSMAAESSSDGTSPPPLLRRLGAVQVTAADIDPNTPTPVFPVASIDFHDRRCRIADPFCGALRPDKEYVFVLDAPHTQYKADEMKRVEASLEAAVQRTESSRSITAQLEQAVASAAALILVAEGDEKATLPPLQAELVVLQRELAKKKGKDLDKAKAAIVELEEKVAALSHAVQKATAAKVSAEEKLAAHRRSSRQASAMRRRYNADREQLRSLTDRSKPLDVEMSVDERRAKFSPSSADGTQYTLRIRTPQSGRLTAFISGVAALSFDVVPEAADWPDTSPTEW